MNMLFVSVERRVQCSRRRLRRRRVPLFCGGNGGAQLEFTEEEDDDAKNYEHECDGETDHGTAGLGWC
jgi:hypothetical protein